MNKQELPVLWAQAELLTDVLCDRLYWGMVDVEGEIWHGYHNISECYYHIQLTVKYRKVLMNEKVQEVIVETLKGFKERYAIELSTIGFDQNHIHILCRFLPKYSGGQVIRTIKSITV